MAFIKKQINVPISQNERAHARDYESLILQLESNDPIARRWAARDLADYPQASTALILRLLSDEELSVREVILSSLAAIGDETVVMGLIKCLRTEDPWLSNEAIDIMKLLPDQVAPIMYALLADADADVRIFAVNILESLRHPAVESWLIEVIQRDTNVNVCATALDLLVEVGSKASEQALKHLLARFPDEPYIQFAVDLALKRLSEN